MENNNIKLTILVSNYSKAERVVENIKSLLSQETDFEYKIFITEVSCNEEQIRIIKEGVKNYSNVELIINCQNIGYSRSHNKINGRILGKYIFVVNPDIIFKEKDVLQKSVDYMDANSDIAILGPQQINDTGEIAMSVRAFPEFYIQVARRTFLRNLPIIKEKVTYDEMNHLDYSKIQDVDWLQSSCVIIRRNFWEKVGGYNETYFLFMADTEMCLKAWEMGYRVVYYPEVRVYADGKRLSAGGFATFFKSWVLRQHVLDSLKYNLKHFFSPNPRKKYYLSQQDKAAQKRESKH